MVSIAVNSAREQQTFVGDFGIDPGEWVYVLQYDLPGIELPDQDTTGAHHHVIPMLAVADYMMATGSSSAEEAVEFCVLDRVQAIYADEDAPGLEAGNLDVGRQVADRSRSLAESRASMREAILEAAGGIPIEPEDSLDDLTDAFFSSLSPSVAARSSRFQLSDSVQDVRSRIASEKEKISDVTVDKNSKGWNTVQTLTMNAGSKIEEAQRRSFDIRYADDVRHVLTRRFVEMGRFNEPR